MNVKRMMRKKTRKKMNRSGSQECPICKEKHVLIEHHIEGRDIPNANHSSNLAYICDNCHREVHEGIIIIEGYLQTTHGKELFWHRKDEESFSGNDAAPYQIPK